MGKTYLLDTNTVIDYIGGTLPPQGRLEVFNAFSEGAFTSVVNKIELLGFQRVPSQIVEFVEGLSIIPLNKEMEITTIELRKKYKIKLPDAIIAATAIVYNLTLITRNIADFQRIENIKIVNPHTFAR